MKKFKNYIIPILFLITLATNAQTLIGKVVGISDGDTFKLLVNNSELHKIRVASIDCPETKQPFSAKAKKFTSDAVFNKTVKVNVLSTDRYGRLIGLVIYNGSLNLSQELVKHGLAWHYVKYSKDSILQSLENTARSNKRGLWQDPTSIPPWEWRSNKKKIKTINEVN